MSQPQAPTRIKAHSKPRSFRSRFIISIGILLVLAGIVVGWFLWQESYGTNVPVAQKQTTAVQQLKAQFGEKTTAAAPTTAKPRIPVMNPPVTEKVAYGEPFGLLRIPELDNPDGTYEKALIQGSDGSVLDTYGIGHYEKTEMPGAVGNVALAGHRNGHGALFNRVQELKAGDPIYIETKLGTYTYKVTSQKTVSPTDTGVLLPVPEQPGVKATKRLLTLTTCGDWNDQVRVITYAEYADFSAR